MPSKSPSPKPASKPQSPKAAKSSAAKSSAPKGLSDKDKVNRAVAAADLAKNAAPKKKTSVTGRALSGATTGATTGAAVGSIVPGVGTVAGAAIGAGVGAAGGAASGRKAKRAEKRAQQGPYSQILVAEFVICTIILALSPLGQEKANPGTWMKKGSAVCGLFLVLGLIGSIGKGSAKVAAAFGGIVTLTLLVNERNIFGVVAKKLATPGSPQENIGPVGERVGDIIRG